MAPQRRRVGAEPRARTSSPSRRARRRRASTTPTPAARGPIRTCRSRCGSTGTPTATASSTTSGPRSTTRARARCPLAGWWFRDSWLNTNRAGVPGYAFPSGATIPAGGSIRLNVAAGRTRRPTFFWCQTSTAFENASHDRRDIGDGGYLFDRDGDLRASMIYPCLLSLHGRAAGPGAGARPAAGAGGGVGVQRERGAAARSRATSSSCTTRSGAGSSSPPTRSGAIRCSSRATRSTCGSSSGADGPLERPVADRPVRAARPGGHGEPAHASRTSCRLRRLGRRALLSRGYGV